MGSVKKIAGPNVICLFPTQMPSDLLSATSRLCFAQNSSICSLLCHHTLLCVLTSILALADIYKLDQAYGLKFLSSWKSHQG